MNQTSWVARRISIFVNRKDRKYVTFNHSIMYTKQKCTMEIFYLGTYCCRPLILLWSVQKLKFSHLHIKKQNLWLRMAEGKAMLVTSNFCPSLHVGNEAIYFPK